MVFKLFSQIGGLETSRKSEGFLKMRCLIFWPFVIQSERQCVSIRVNAQDVDFKNVIGMSVLRN